jgi:Uncharacterized Fe-S protein
MDSKIMQHEYITKGVCLLFQENLLDRFRSNLVIQGLKPFEENDWTQFQIGKVKFQVSLNSLLTYF